MSSLESRRSGELARELGLRVSAAGALLVALGALLTNAPLGVACARGVGTLLLLGLGARLGAAALAHAVDFDRAHARTKEKARP